MGSTESPENVIRVCAICESDNLLRRIGIKKCPRCTQPFCVHFASAIDAMFYCAFCFNDMEVERKIVTKEYPVRDRATGEVVDVYRRKAVSTEIGGLDWLFQQRRISDMEPEELSVAVTYHRMSLQLILDEQEKKKAERLHRAAEKKAKSAVSITESKTEIKKTSVKAPVPQTAAKKQEKAQDIVAQMLAKGLSLEQLTKILGG